jgi:uncharacterized protein DUF3108
MFQDILTFIKDSEGRVVKKVLPLLCALLFLAQQATADPEPGQKPIHNVATVNHAFSAGERLTYLISWSDIIDAGTAVMEVREEKQTDGKKVYRLVSTAHSSGLVSKFYKVNDMIESIIDSERLCSLSYRSDQSHGKRKKKRSMTFNQAEGTVVVVDADGKQDTYSTPPGILDPLSSLYYVRTRQDLIVGKPIFVDVHDDDKNWAVEVQMIGREKIKTSLGKFNTIKIKTYPRYEGVFQHKGEIYIWFTDDERKIPVLMKSEISIGSIMATLVAMQAGEEKK